MKRHALIGTHPRFPKGRLTAAVALFASIGVVVLVGARAASGTFMAIEPEAGTLSGVTAVTDATASGGNAVKFGSGSSQTSNCAPNPHLCGYPDSTNTGATGTLQSVPSQVSSGNGWTYVSGSGYIEVSGSGVTVSNISCNCNLDITGSNVTIKNVKILGPGGLFGISLRHTANVTIEDSTITGENPSGGTGEGTAPGGNDPTDNNRLEVGIKTIYGDETGTQVLRNNVAFTSTGIQMDDGLVQDNYVHDMAMQASEHVNGTTSNGGSSTLVLRHNTVFNAIDQTDCISLFEDFGGQSNKTIDNNLVAGGGYSIYGGQNTGGATATNIKVTNNRFARKYHSTSGNFGPMAAIGTGSGDVTTGNVWDDTGAAVGI